MKQILFRTTTDAQKFRDWLRDELDIRVDIFDVGPEKRLNQKGKTINP